MSKAEDVIAKAMEQSETLNVTDYGCETLARSVLAALDAAGLAVVPVRSRQMRCLSQGIGERMDKLNLYDIEALKMLNGDLPIEYGARFNVCCEFLSEAGYATRRPYMISEKGREWLRKNDND